MVNVWATWCGPCVNEMDDLQKVYESVTAEKNMKLNMISVCADLADEPDAAKEIIAANGCKFKVIAPDDTIGTNVLNDMQYLPTTYFVDSKGKIIGEPMDQLSLSDDIATQYLAAIKNRYDLLPK